jgi:hypothetical protein
VLTGPACTSDLEAGDQIGRARAASLAVPGPWIIPDDVGAAGDGQYVDFTGAGPWIGEEGCGGGLLEGSAVLREYIADYFPQAWSIGGYACRPIVGDPDSMSVHATGRALDVMIYPVGYPDGTAADNEMGDPIANWLIVNAERIGIQQIIWDRWLWRAEDPAGQKDRAYTGEHPHNDHIHLELSVEAADLGTAFFHEEQAPPALPSCGRVPAEGAVIDDVDRCADFFGPPEYWRSVDGSGEGGGLLWTDSFQAADPSNWAAWSLDFAAAGRYRVEYRAVQGYALAPRVRYEIEHAGTTDEIWVDQGAVPDGWVSLGEFDFAGGGYQHVALFDNTDQPVAADQHIVFDALRLTPCPGGECAPAGGDDGSSDDGSGDDGSGDGTDPGDPGDPGGDPGSPELGGGGGGCSAAPGRGASGGALLLVATALLTRSRRRRRG